MLAAVLLCAQATKESRGVQLVRSGRAARLDAVHRQLFGDKDAGAALQPDQQQQQPSSRRLGQGPGQASAIGAAGSPPRSSAAVRRSWGGDAGSPAGGVSSSSAGLRTLPSLQEHSSSSGQSPTRRITAGGVAGESLRCLTGEVNLIEPCTCLVVACDTAVGSCLELLC
jgi:hypothetical protein